MSKYTVTISGDNTNSIVLDCDTITEGRKLAESYGDTMRWATIKDKRGNTVGSHMLDTSTRKWYKAGF